MTNVWRRILLVGAIVALSACAGMRARPHTYEQAQGEWRDAVPSSDLRDPVGDGLGD
jgi:hypothetical protein